MVVGIVFSLGIKLIVIKIREIVRENKGRDKFERELVRRFFLTLNLFILRE